MTLPSLLRWLALALPLTLAAFASAQTPDAAAVSRYDVLSDLERPLVERALDALGLTPAHTPAADARVCTVHVQRYRIVREEDRLPLWLNRFHTLSRERVIRRAVVSRSGEPYTERARAESERQLRDPLLFGAAVVVPVEGEPGCVDLLVVTRDAWSLTFNVAPETNGATLSRLYVGLTEANLAGTNALASLSYDMDPAAWSLGTLVSARRLGRHRIAISQSFRVHGDRERGRGIDGTSSGVRVERPLFASHVRWGAFAAFNHSVTVARSLAGDRVRAYPTAEPARDEEGRPLYLDEAGELTTDPGEDGEHLALAETVDERWRQRYFGGEVGVTRSWGTRWKNNLTPRLFASDLRARALPYADVSEAALAEFEEQVLPRSERTIGPGLRWSSFDNRHVYFRNIETYGFSEELRRGYASTLGLGWSEPTLGSTARFVSASWSHTLRAVFDDGYLALGAAPSVRVDGDWSDLRVGGSVRGVTPSWFWGRLVARVSGSTVYRNEANTRVALGGRTSVRGYAEGFALGDRALRTNLEWRSRPLNLALWRLGFTAFYDGAATWFEGEPVDYYPSLGVGLRVVIPQLGTRVRAADLAFPLRDAPGPGRAGVPLFSFGLDQSF